MLPFFYRGADGSGRIWDGYYTIAVPAGQAEELLSSGWFSDLDKVSSYNTVLTFNDYGVDEDVALNEISGRFIEGDPRLDDFMVSASAYFNTVTEDGRKMEVFYIRSSLSAIRFYFKVRSSYGDDVKNWIFPDVNIQYRFGAVVLFVLCWAFGIFVIKGRRSLAVLSALPWMASIIFCSPDMLAASVVNYLIFILAVRELYPDLLFYLNYRELRISSKSVFFAAAAVASVVATSAGHLVQGIAFLPLLSSFAAEAVLLYVYYGLKRERASRQEHRLFFPVRMASMKPAASDRKVLPVYAAAATAAILVPLFAIFISETADVPVPVPAAAAQNASWSLDYLETLDQSEAGLANAADFVKHQHYQQGFMYGAPYKIPKSGEKLLIDRYVVENSKISLQEKAAVEFTDNWYLNIIKPENQEGLLKLLLGQKVPTGIYLRSEFSFVPAYSTKGHLLICLAVFLPIAVRFLSIENITVRRKGQEA